MYAKRLPLTPGWDGSGIIEEAGPDAAALKPGDAVNGTTDAATIGTYAG